MGGKYTPIDARGFYDKTAAGATRAVRNDLGGTLPGMVQFAQSHTVDPAGNGAKDMPTLTTSREAMLLVTPAPSLGDVDSMQVTVTVNGESKGTLVLRHPNEMFRSDFVANDGRPDYVYSRRAWSAVLPWDWVQPGLALRVSDSNNRTGHLAANAIEFAAPAELVVHSIKLGMLTPPENNDNAHWFRSHPAEAATDYFQTIPAAQLTAAYYEDITLSKVMVASGAVYTTASAVEGGMYAGDMRENTAKSTFSVGINLANYGVTSASMQSQQQPHVFQSVVIHHARGVYTNGALNHGLSGGNGILTLLSSKGNEFSHEIGHHYGLGHYPGQQGENYFWSGHHHDSGWGFVAHRKRMRGNLLWNSASTGGLSGMPTLDNTYQFGTDAMSGGHYASALSQYTHYTGYSTKRAIQPALDKPLPTQSSPTGYQKWNASTKAMENVAPAIPNQAEVWYNSASGKFLAPRLQGVPVVTLLGGYDPVNDQAVMYPALRSNWGNVFTLPAQAVQAEARQCWLDVQFAGGGQQRIALAGRRMQANSVNKFHVNLAQADKPSQARLQCQTPGQAVVVLDTINIRTDLPAMPPAVVVGKAERFAALRAVELPQLDTALKGLANKTVLALGKDAQVLYDSYSDDAQQLSAAGQLQFKRYAQQQEQGMRLNRWMSTYANALEQQNPEAQNALLDFIGTLGLSQSPLIPAAQAMSMANGNCIQKDGAGVRVAGKSLCTGSTSEQWILDGRGAIRSRADLGQCLTDRGGNSAVALAACDVRNDNQVWDTSVPKRIARGNRCLDLNLGYLTNNVGTLITYSCTGGGNQQWAGLQPSDNLLLSLVSSSNVRYLEMIAAKRALAR